MDMEEVAQQMAADDFVQPQALQPEMELPDELNLDGSGSDMDEAGIQTEQGQPADAEGETNSDAEQTLESMDADKAPPPEDQEPEEPAPEEYGGSDDAGVDAVDDEASGGDPAEKHEQADVPAAPADFQEDVQAGPQGEQGAAAMDTGQHHGASGAPVSGMSALPQDAAVNAPSDNAEPGTAPDAAHELDGAVEADTPALGTDKSQSRQDSDHALRPQRDANPLRHLGSAQEQWRHEFEVIQDAAEVDKGLEQPTDDEAGFGTQFEFASVKDETIKQQALASATQEQAEQQHGETDRSLQETEECAERNGSRQEERSNSADAEVPEYVRRGGGNLQGVVNRLAAGQEGEGADDVADKDVVEELDMATAKTSLNAGGFASVHGASLVGPDTESTDAAMRADSGVGRLHLPGEEEDNIERGLHLWRRCTAATSALTGELVEQLRLVLEPTLASRLSGEFKTGKRLNMKKVIAYIASNFRRDKIWMRRTSPDKRDYQVLLAIDDTKSMQENHCAVYALQALTLLTTALSRLEVGTLGVAAFGGINGTRVLHELGSPWTDMSAAAALGALTFEADNTLQDTPLLDLLHTVGRLFEAQRHVVAGRSGLSLPSQLLLIIADGHFHERTALQRSVRQASGDTSGNGPLIVFIILDAAAESVLDLQQVTFNDGVPTFNKYLDSFPFPYYIALRDIYHLPHLLADLLRQWLQMCTQ
eukprot:jgi/Ulvmu1/4351/UM002_0076.1